MFWTTFTVRDVRLAHCEVLLLLWCCSLTAEGGWVGWLVKCLSLSRITLKISLKETMILSFFQNPQHIFSHNHRHSLVSKHHCAEIDSFHTFTVLKSVLYYRTTNFITYTQGWSFKTPSDIVCFTIKQTERNFFFLYRCIPLLYSVILTHATRSIFILLETIMLIVNVPNTF